MIHLKNKTVVTHEMKREHARLLEIWENQWSIMSNDDVRRFLLLERVIKMNRKFK